MAKRSTSAERAHRKSERRRARNRAARSTTKTAIRKAERLIQAGALVEATAAVQEALGTLDKGAQKGIIHPNNAARRKSRLMKKLNDAQAASAA